MFDFIGFILDIFGMFRNRVGRAILFTINIGLMIIGAIAISKGSSDDGFIFIAIGAIFFVILLLVGEKKKDDI